MLRIVANNAQMTLAADDFALCTYFLNRGFYFHIKNAYEAIFTLGQRPDTA
jgi:hypothetical protein